MTAIAEAMPIFKASGQNGARADRAWGHYRGMAAEKLGYRAAAPCDVASCRREPDNALGHGWPATESTACR